MNITLYYRGPLKANADAKEKNKLRLHFHQQLLQLWQQPPLDRVAEKASASKPLSASLIQEDTSDISKRFNKIRQALQFPSLTKSVNNIIYVPLVTSLLDTIAHLQITLLRPELPGHIVTQGGDIDNRLKTLLDALCIPDLNQAKRIKEILPIPFYVLLEDDSLITQVSVKTDRLLESVNDKSETILLIEVTTRTIAENIFNGIFK